MSHWIISNFQPVTTTAPIHCKLLELPTALFLPQRRSIRISHSLSSQNARFLHQPTTSPRQTPHPRLLRRAGVGGDLGKARKAALPCAHDLRTSCCHADSYWAICSNWSGGTRQRDAGRCVPWPGMRGKDGSMHGRLLAREDAGVGTCVRDLSVSCVLGRRTDDVDRSIILVLHRRGSSSHWATLES